MAATGRANLAVLLLADGQLDEAMSEYRKVLELSPSGISDSRGTDARFEINIQIVRILILQRRYEEAQAAIAQLPEGKFRDHGLALLWDVPGRLPEADLALQRLATQPEGITDSIRLAEVYAFRGMSQEAFASLQRRLEALERDEHGPRAASRCSSIRSYQRELLVSPLLKPLHADPRWAALMSKADFDYDRTSAQSGCARRRVVDDLPGRARQRAHGALGIGVRSAAVNQHSL